MRALRERLAALRRPWSRPLLVLVVAIVAGTSGYAMAATRPVEEAPRSAPIAPGDWIDDRPLESSVSEDVAVIERQAIAAVPDGVTPFKSVLVSQNVNFYGGQLIALPAGEYRVYVSCRSSDLEYAAGTREIDALLSIDHDGAHTAKTVACPSDPGEPLPLSVGQDTVFLLSSSPTLDGTDDDARMMSIALAMGVFIERVR